MSLVLSADVWGFHLSLKNLSASGFSFMVTLSFLTSDASGAILFPKGSNLEMR